MKNVILLMALILPFSVFAQTRPAPSKIDREAASEMRFKPVADIGSFTYLIMNVKEVKADKKGDRTILEYKFESNDPRSESAFEKMSSRFERVIDVINAIGLRGWELSAVEGNNYYFKMKVHKQPERSNR